MAIVFHYRVYTFQAKQKEIYISIHERLQYQVFRIDLYGVSAQSAAITRTRQLLAAALTETICSTNDI